MNKPTKDEQAATALSNSWYIKYGSRLCQIQELERSSTSMQVEGFTDLLYKTFPYLSKKNPYNE